MLCVYISADGQAEPHRSVLVSHSKTRDGATLVQTCTQFVRYKMSKLCNNIAISSDVLRYLLKEVEYESIITNQKGSTSSIGINMFGAARIKNTNDNRYHNVFSKLDKHITCHKAC